MDLFASESLLFLLYFIGCCAGQDDVLPHGPVDAKVGTNATIKTLLKNPDFAFVIWSYSDGEESVNVATLTTVGLKVNDPRYEGRVWINATNGNLHLGPLRPEDSGDYSINVVSDDGTTRTGEIRLEVLEPVSDVVIKSNLPEAVEQKSTVVLSCTSKGSFLKFTWINSTTEIKVDGVRLTLQKDDESSNLTIRNVLRTDLVGPIFCTAANNLDNEKSAPFNLTVFYGPEQVTVTPANPPSVLASGSNFSLTCSAVSNPPATFNWMHNEKMLETAGPVLTLKDIQKEGLGKVAEDYVCKAKNAKTELSVDSPAVSFAMMDPISDVKISLNSAPEVLVAGNSSANLSCMATAGVVKTITWMKDGKPLSASGRLVFAADMSSLMITELQKEDNGEFVCQLTNPVSSEKASYKMVVNYGPEPVQVKGQSEAELDDRVTLTCSAASIPPASFTWKFNGTLTETKTAEYVIEKAVYKNSGTYTCEAFNAITGKKSSQTHNLAVKEEIGPDGLSDGAIAGIVIGVIAALAIAIGLMIYCRQKVPVESPY